MKVGPLDLEEWPCRKRLTLSVRSTWYVPQLRYMASDVTVLKTNDWHVNPKKDILARTSLKAIQFTEFPTAIDQVVDHRPKRCSQWYTDSSLRFFLQQAPSKTRNMSRFQWGIPTPGPMSCAKSSDLVTFNVPLGRKNPAMFWRLMKHIRLSKWLNYCWLVVSNMNLFSIIYGMSSFPLTFFQRGWNHQPDCIAMPCLFSYLLVCSFGLITFMALLSTIIHYQMRILQIVGGGQGW